MSVDNTLTERILVSQPSSSIGAGLPTPFWFIILLLNSRLRKGIRPMEEIAEENVNLSWEIRVSEGRAGTDPEAPDWEVAELENGVVKKKEDIYDNLTYAEAQQIAGMWTKKKEDAGV
jgi:hypothetical protein